MIVSRGNVRPPIMSYQHNAAGVVDGRLEDVVQRCHDRAKRRSEEVGEPHGLLVVVRHDADNDMMG